MKSVTVRVDDELHARFKGYCETQGISMQKELEGFMSKCITSNISEPKFSKGFLNLFPFKPHEILLQNGLEPQKILNIMEVLEENFKKVYEKPTNKGFYEFFMRVLRIFVAKKL
jgi:hypothetical protein